MEIERKRYVYIQMYRPAASPANNTILYIYIDEQKNRQINRYRYMYIYVYLIHKPTASPANET